MACTILGKAVGKSKSLHICLLWKTVSSNQLWKGEAAATLKPSKATSALFAWNLDHSVGEKQELDFICGQSGRCTHVDLSESVKAKALQGMGWKAGPLVLQNFENQRSGYFRGVMRRTHKGHFLQPLWGAELDCMSLPQCGQQGDRALSPPPGKGGIFSGQLWPGRLWRQ